MIEAISDVACSQTLYCLFKVRRARVIKCNRSSGFIDRQHKRVVVGEEENGSLFFFLALRASSRFARALADVFEKNNKTTSVYKLFRTSYREDVFILSCYSEMSGQYFRYFRIQYV